MEEMEYNNNDFAEMMRKIGQGIRGMSQRAIFISHSIRIEQSIDKFVCNYFCDSESKSKELLYTLVGTEKLRFEIKKQLLEYILTTHYSKWIKENPKFLKSISLITPFRNLMAHADFHDDTIFDSSETVVIFKAYNEGKPRQKVYDRDKMWEIYNAFDLVLETAPKLESASPD